MNDFNRQLYEDIGVIKQALKNLNGDIPEIQRRLTRIESRIDFWRGAMWAWSMGYGIIGGSLLWAFKVFVIGQ